MKKRLLIFSLILSLGLFFAISPVLSQSDKFQQNLYERLGEIEVKQNEILEKLEKRKQEHEEILSTLKEMKTKQRSKWGF